MQGAKWGGEGGSPLHVLETKNNGRVFTWPSTECQSLRRETRAPTVSVAWCEMLESKQDEEGVCMGKQQQ